jgi:hypothetical protein
MAGVINPTAALPQYDSDNGQSGMYGTPQGAPPNTTIALGTANRIYVTRFVPSRNMTIVSGSFGVSAAASVDDQIDIGIYDSAGNLIRAAGATAGKLNTTGRKILTLSASAALTARTVYYSVACNALGGTAATVSGYGVSISATQDLFNAAEGATAGPPHAELGFMAGSAVALPSTLPTLVWSAINSAVGVAWREF